MSIALFDSLPPLRGLRIIWSCCVWSVNRYRLSTISRRVTCPRTPPSTRCTSTIGSRTCCDAARICRTRFSSFSSTTCTSWIHSTATSWPLYRGCQLVCRRTCSSSAAQQFPSSSWSCRRSRRSVSRIQRICSTCNSTVGHWSSCSEEGWMVAVRERPEVGRRSSSLSKDSLKGLRNGSGGRACLVWQPIWRAPNTVWPKRSCWSYWCQRKTAKHFSTLKRDASTSLHSDPSAIKWVSGREAINCE